MKRFLEVTAGLMLLTSAVGCHCNCGNRSWMAGYPNTVGPIADSGECQPCQENMTYESLAPGQLQPTPEPVYQHQQQYPPIPEPTPVQPVKPEGEPHGQPKQEAVQRRTQQVVAPAALLAPQRVEPKPIIDSRQIDYDAPARL